ncbi:hypothetical protein J6590_020354 [Homalodisca vitripennis]|nr:hypothetical protein J6590_020354 [Homalodisca vitripennis]
MWQRELAVGLTYTIQRDVEVKEQARVCGRGSWRCGGEGTSSSMWQGVLVVGLTFKIQRDVEVKEQARVCGRGCGGEGTSSSMWQGVLVVGLTFKIQRDVEGELAVGLTYTIQRDVEVKEHTIVGGGWWCGGEYVAGELVGLTLNQRDVGRNTRVCGRGLVRLTFKIQRDVSEGTHSSMWQGCWWQRVLVAELTFKIQRDVKVKEHTRVCGRGCWWQRTHSSMWQGVLVAELTFKIQRDVKVKEHTRVCGRGCESEGTHSSMWQRVLVAELTFKIQRDVKGVLAAAGVRSVQKPSTIQNLTDLLQLQSPSEMYCGGMSAIINLIVRTVRATALPLSSCPGNTNCLYYLTLSSSCRYKSKFYCRIG